MAEAEKCATCSSTAAFFCLCAKLPFCGGSCFVDHLTTSNSSIHSTLPVSKTAVFETTISSLDITYRDAVTETLALLIHNQINSITAFAEDSSDKVRSKGEELLSTIIRLRDEKSEELRTACTAAQDALRILMDDIEGPSPGSERRGLILADNIILRKLPLADLKLVNLSFKCSDPEFLKDFISTSISFPSNDVKEMVFDYEAQRKEQELKDIEEAKRQEQDKPIAEEPRKLEVEEAGEEEGFDLFG